MKLTFTQAWTEFIRTATMPTYKRLKGALNFGCAQKGRPLPYQMSDY